MVITSLWKNTPITINKIANCIATINIFVRNVPNIKVKLDVGVI